MFDTIQFPYNYVATIQATALLLTIYDRPLHWQYLIYLLYLSDREHLICYGSPITGDTYICLEGKPTLLCTAELLHYSTPNIISILQNPRTKWHHYFSLPNPQGKVKIITHPGDTELSSSIKSAIQEVFRTCHQFDLYALERWCYSLSECEDRGYLRLIEISELLAKNGYELEDLIAIKNDADTECYFAKIENN